MAGVEAAQWKRRTLAAVWGKRQLCGCPGGRGVVRAYPAVVEGVCDALMAAEHAWLELGGRWAWGTSVLGVGVKPA